MSPLLDTYVLRSGAFAAAIVLSIPSLVQAQDAAALDVFVDACTPVTATGPDIRSTMVAGGWTPQSINDAGKNLGDLIGAHLNSFRPGIQTEDVPAAVADLATAFRASMTDPDRGQLYKIDGAVAVVLSQDENLSCFWAGPDDAAFAGYGETYGPFPPLDDVFTISSVTNQEEFTEGGRSWLRNTKFSRMTEGTQTGPYTVIARIDRSPA